MKVCFKCKQNKTLENYTSAGKKDKSIRRSWCKDCCSIYQKERSYAFKSRTGIDLSVFYSHQTSRKYLIRLLAFARYRAKNKNLEMSIDIDFLEKIYKKQNGLCSISGIQMTYVIVGGNKNTRANMSIDRIDSSKGYSKDNVQLVCDIVNRMKLDFDQNAFINICKQIGDKHVDKASKK